MSSQIDPDGVNSFVNNCYPELGSRCVEIGSDFAVAEYDLSGIARRPGGYISGPDQFRLADGALWFLTFHSIGLDEEMAVTSELSILYLRPAPIECASRSLVCQKCVLALSRPNYCQRASR